jgi:3-hydroxyethyl bacteriochlorophyllide a dehydrogenase
MKTVAVVLRQPEQLILQQVDLLEAAATDIVVDIEWSGISTGTERLFWTGRMPPFPGMGYPLVPGYESLGRVRVAGAESGHEVGACVFVPGSRGFKDVRGLFGGAASTLVVAGDRAVTLDDDVGEQGILLALAATAQHAIAGGALPDLIVGHGVLGRLLARLCVVMGGSPVVWEIRSDRASGAQGYTVVRPGDDHRRDYRSIYDVSGDAALLDALIQRLAPGGEIVLAGFYSEPLAFAFPSAFMREARLRVAAEWKDADLRAVRTLVQSGQFSLDGLITHREPARRAGSAYRTAFEDPACLKMILDWRSPA